MKRKHNAPAGETAHQPRFWIDGGDPRQTDMQAIFEQIGQPAQNAPQSRQDAAGDDFDTDGPFIYGPYENAAD